METLNRLIQFTLFLMGKFNSKLEQIESRTASWNRLCSPFEGPLYLKLSACRTYNSKEEKTVPGFKVAKDRLIFLLGGNASTGHKLKLYLVYNSENPCALRN